nr:immunoglobulin heavy chain junction region [Mus musculus]NSM07620.1 immunoglobulin heavy chain junction region [Mus musculus]NSM09420.1 immunoglobulin heavy chain junction region [Mus musculus]
CTLFYYAMDYW